MEKVVVLFWSGCEPHSITFNTTEKLSLSDILCVLNNSDIDIINISVQK